MARAYAGDPKGLVEIMKKAIQYEGFAFVDIVQSCISFGKEHDYFKDKVYYLDDSYDANDKIKALSKALEYEEIERFALGVIYQE